MISPCLRNQKSMKPNFCTGLEIDSYQELFMKKSQSMKKQMISMVYSSFKKEWYNSFCLKAKNLTQIKAKVIFLDQKTLLTTVTRIPLKKVRKIMVNSVLQSKHKNKKELLLLNVYQVQQKFINYLNKDYIKF